MEKEYTIKELIPNNILFKTEYYFNTTHNLSSLSPNKEISFVIGPLNVELISNPIFIFELDEENYDLEFDIDSVFDYIELKIGGLTIDKLYDEQIKIYNLIYGFEIKKVGSKIFYPIPFYCMNNGYGIFASKCKYNNINIKIKFSYNEFVRMIKQPVIRTEFISDKSYDVDFSILNTYFYKYYIKKINNSQINLSHLNKDHEKIQYVKIKNNQFSGIINLQQNTPNVKIKCDFNHCIDKFFIYFQNINDKTIYTNIQQFEIIKFIIEKNIVLEYDYISLLNNNSKSVYRYDIPNGIFEIKWNLDKYKNFSRIHCFEIEFIGLMVPHNVGFCICAESLNYLIYRNDMCGLYLSN